MPPQSGAAILHAQIIMMEEIWKDIEGYEGYYQFSNLGRVKSFSRIVTYINRNGIKCEYLTRDRFLKDGNSSGYRIVNLTNADGVKKIHFVHRAVLCSFLGFASNMYVNHIDGDKSNNILSNLEWVTPLENIRHAKDKGLFKPKEYSKAKGERSGKSKLTVQDVIMIRKSNLSNMELGRRMNLSNSTISNVRLGKTWGHV